MTSNREWMHSAPLEEIYAWMGAEHVDVDEPHDGDAVAILRKAATCTSANTSVGDVLRYNVPGNEPSAWQTEEDACKALADMVERDYVSREAYDYAHREFNRMNEERREAFAERDEWKAKCERESEAIGEWELRCERLESECDEYEDIVDALTQQIGELKAKAKVKSAKRAAAAERLKDVRYHTLADYVRAMLGWGHEPHFEDCRDALIDLLTDEGSSKVRAGSSNLEWLYEHDSDFAWKIDNLAWDAGGFSTSQPLDEIPWTHPKMREWLMAPHDGAHSKAQSKNAPTLSDLYGILSDGNAPETPDFAENPQKTPEEEREIPADADNRKPTDAVKEFAERYEQRIAELERELDTAYGALEIAVKNESRLERERDGWRMRCGDLLDAAHAMQGVADAWDEEV